MAQDALPGDRGRDPQHHFTGRKQAHCDRKVGGFRAGAALHRFELALRRGARDARALVRRPLRRRNTRRLWRRTHGAERTANRHWAVRVRPRCAGHEMCLLPVPRGLAPAGRRRVEAAAHGLADLRAGRGDRRDGRHGRLSRDGGVQGHGANRPRTRRRTRKSAASFHGVLRGANPVVASGARPGADGAREPLHCKHGGLEAHGGRDQGAGLSKTAGNCAWVELRSWVQACAGSQAWRRDDAQRDDAQVGGLCRRRKDLCPECDPDGGRGGVRRANLPLACHCGLQTPSRRMVKRVPLFEVTM
mmetsp:Transcript_48731/g.110591  ORF Transcript_48731/g.110591 Transcript_48731/m.110591 type:complete len:303 (+) Transcript_48731:125-1033(+)